MAFKVPKAVSDSCYAPQRSLSRRQFGVARRAGSCLAALSLSLLLASCAGEASDSAADRPTVTQTITKAGPPPSESQGKGNGSGDEEMDAEPQEERAWPKPQRVKKGECPYLERNSNTRLGEIVSMYCDGRWMRAGRSSTDHLWVERFDGTEWVEVDADGVTTSGMQGPCFSDARLRSLGAPEKLIDMVTLCE